MRNGSHRFWLCIAAAVAVTAIAVPAASADFRSVNDPRGDTTCGHELGGHKPCSDRKRRSADIVRATAGHDGALLKHTIRVVGKFKFAAFDFNTDSYPSCEFYLFAIRGVGRDEVRECDVSGGPGRVTGHARYDFHRHSVEIVFSESAIGNPQSYGWRAQVDVGRSHASAFDFIPNWGGRIQHRLAVPALGAQTAAASAGVHKYDTKLTITTERGFRYHGWVKSDRDSNPAYHAANKFKKCMEGRRVTLFEQRPGADRKLAKARSRFTPRNGHGQWPRGGGGGRLGTIKGPHAGQARVYARVKREEHNRYVCRADRSPTI
jgi:hypothetical protein